MLRKIGYSLLCASALMSANVYSITSHLIQPGFTFEYSFQPNEPQLFYNFTFSPIEANCRMVTEENNILFVEAISKKGKVNTTVLQEGESIQVDISSGIMVKIGAEVGAKVRITNLGQHNIKATCST